MGAARHTAKASKAKWAVGSLNVETEAEHTKLQKRFGVEPDIQAYRGASSSSANDTKECLVTEGCERRMRDSVSANRISL